MTKQSTISADVTTAAVNASAAAASAATAAAAAADNARIASKAAAESAVAIVGVAKDTDWMKKALERVEVTLNEMNKAFVTAAQHVEVLKSIDDHGNRLNSLETEKTRIVVLASVVGAILLTLTGLLIKHLFES